VTTQSGIFEAEDTRRDRVTPQVFNYRH
jgi:hypothetical protein